MYTTTKNPPREAVLFPGGVLSRKSEQMFHVKHFAGSWRAAGPAVPVCPPGRRAACGPYLGFCRDYPSSCRRTSTRMTPAIRAGMADKRSLPPGEAGISSSQLMVIISPAMQAVTMPMV
mgnify:CR=1 FL=1